MSTISPTLKAKILSLERKQKGLVVYNGGLGENPLSAPEFLKESLQKHSHLKSYTSVNGIPKLNGKILEFYTSNMYTPHFAILGNGLKELIFNCQFSFKGKIIYFTPCWVSYLSQMKLMGREKDMIYFPLDIRENFSIDYSKLNGLLSSIKGDKMVIFNNPCNPTGRVYNSIELKYLASIFRRHNTIVLADEIYLNLGQGKQVHSISKYLPNLTIRGSSLSKDMACSGYRIGWMTFPKHLERLYNKMVEFGSKVYSCPSHCLQEVAYERFTNIDRVNDFIKKNNLVFKTINRRVVDILQKTKILFYPNHGAWYYILYFDEYPDLFESFNITNSYELSEMFINEIGWITIPGEAFGGSKTCLRFAYVDFDVAKLSNKTFDVDIIDESAVNIYKGLDVLSGFLKNYEQKYT